MATIELDTLIVGGGQAGLATSYYLTAKGHKHIIWTGQKDQPMDGAIEAGTPLRW